MKNKIRYSFPGRIYELLLTDDKFLQEISKLRKIENPFPRYDQWKDEDGFHISFALAGYAPEDISIVVRGRQISLAANGLQSISTPDGPIFVQEEVEHPEKEPIWTVSEEQLNNILPALTKAIENEGAEDSGPSLKPPKVSVHKGYVSRGIARRSFKTNLYVSEEFDLSAIKATMAHGLLNIFVPERSLEDIHIKINA